MKVLIACESSGKVRDQLRARGHDAISCDLLPTKRPGPHYQGDVRDILHEAWDMVIAFPTCTYVCGSSIHWVKRGRVEADGRPRAEHMVEGIAFARMFIDGPETAHIPKRVAENPVGVLSTAVRKPDQIVHPYMFGDDASKATCLWLTGVEPLELDPTLFVPPRLVVYGTASGACAGPIKPTAGKTRCRPATTAGNCAARPTTASRKRGRQWGGRALVEDLM